MVCLFILVQVEWDLATDRDGCQNLMCKAVKKTWANQRRKRRLAATRHQQTTLKKPKESTELGKAEADHNDEQKQDDVPVISQEITSVSCDFEFTCILHKTNDVNLVQFKWLRGDSKDNLHQIIQYLKNQAQLSVQTLTTSGK